MKVKQSSAINQISRELGSVSRKSKLIATEQNSGAMPADAYRSFSQINKHLEDLPDQTDILNIGPGYYSVYDPKNSPLANPSRFFVDVKKNSNGDKVIQATALYTGRTWHIVTRTTNNNPDVPSVWVESISERVLWTGSVTSVGTKIELIDNLSNYDGLDIVYTIGSTQQISRIRSVNPDGTFYIPGLIVLNGNNINRDLALNQWYPTRIELTKSSGNELTISYYKLYTISMNPMTAVVTHDTGDFSINAIIGLK